MNDEISIPTDVLIEHVKTIALEYGVFDEHTPDGCDDWSIKSMEVEQVVFDEDYGSNGAIRIFGHDTGTVSRRVTRSTRHSPAEYESLDVRVDIAITFDLTDNNGLGTVQTEVMADGDPREPPEPDIAAARYDL